MYLSPLFAQQIADKISDSIGFDINIFDTNGCVIGSTEEKTILDFHIHAFKAFQAKNEIVMNKENHSEQGIIIPFEFNHNIIGLIGITGDPAEVRGFTGILKIMIESMVLNYFSKHQHRSYSKIRETLIHQLINCSEELDYSTKQQASLLGLDLTLPKVAFVISVDGLESERSPKKIIHKVLDCIDYVLIDHDNYLHSYVGDSTFIIFIFLNKQDSLQSQKNYLMRMANHIMKRIQQTLNYSSIIGVSSLNRDTSFKNTFNDALQTVAISGNESHNQIVFSDDLGIHLILQNIPQTIRDNYISNIVGQKTLTNILDHTLLNTLEVFFDCHLNISETARCLFIHRNTLLYRLDKTYKLTNKDPRKFSDAIELKLLLDLLRENDKKEVLREASTSR